MYGTPIFVYFLIQNSHFVDFNFRNILKLLFHINVFSLIFNDFLKFMKL